MSCGFYIAEICAAARSVIVQSRPAVLMTGMLVAGCAPDSYMGARTTTVQNQFSHLTCVQLFAARTSREKEIEDLTKLTAKAEEGAGGSVIGAAVYGPQLMQARGMRRILDETIADKRCQEEKKPAP